MDCYVSFRVYLCSLESWREADLESENVECLLLVRQMRTEFRFRVSQAKDLEHDLIAHGRVEMLCDPQETLSYLFSDIEVPPLVVKPFAEYVLAFTASHLAYVTNSSVIHSLPAFISYTRIWRMCSAVHRAHMLYGICELGKSNTGANGGLASVKKVNEVAWFLWSGVCSNISCAIA
jgi:hypothetical protein